MCFYFFNFRFALNLELKPILSFPHDLAHANIHLHAWCSKELKALHNVACACSIIRKIAL